MRPGLSCGGGGCLGGAARMFAIAAGGMLGAARGPFVTVSDVWTGPRGRAVSSGSLVLRLVGFGWGCARVRPTRVPMVVEGLHLCAVSGGSLLLRSAVFGAVCASARSFRGLCY